MPGRPLGAMWNRTVTAESRLREHPLYEEAPVDSLTGSFAGRHIIGRDTLINGGVYVGGDAREAIVVDDGRYGDQYDRVYSYLVDAVYAAARKAPGASVHEKVLVPTFETVTSALPYDTVVAKMTEDMLDRKVNLGLFLRQHGGVCRHQALLAGYMLERLRADGELMAEDRVSIDRNYIPGRGGHAWVRYTASDGSPYVLDTAQGVVDGLDSLDGSGWDYRRPEEVS